MTETLAEQIALLIDQLKMLILYVSVEPHDTSRKVQFAQGMAREEVPVIVENVTLDFFNVIVGLSKTEIYGTPYYKELSDAAQYLKESRALPQVAKLSGENPALMLDAYRELLPIEKLERWKELVVGVQSILHS
jgi:hypothetical protein